MDRPSGRQTPVHALNLLFLVAFLLSVMVQYNDPDPWGWALLYGLAAGCCVAFYLQSLYWPVSAVLAAAALAWCLWLLPQFIGQVELRDIFASLRMQTEAVEEAREAGGTLLVALWMLILSVYRYRQVPP